MRKGKTESGFEFELDEQELDDMRFLTLLSKSRNDPLYFPEVIEKMLGEEQADRLYKHLEQMEDGNGHATIEATNDIIAEIMTLAGDETKN